MGNKEEAKELICITNGYELRYSVGGLSIPIIFSQSPELSH